MTSLQDLIEDEIQSEVDEDSYESSFVNDGSVDFMSESSEDDFSIFTNSVFGIDYFIGPIQHNP
jgi:hypothetical protein